MRIPAPPEALRVARALLGVSQRVAAQRAAVTQKSVSAAETGKIILFETNIALVDFYKSQGIEFLGEGPIGEKIRRAGAAWACPAGPAHVRGDVTQYHTEMAEISFKAARALLGLEQSQVAASAGVSIDAIKGVERGDGRGRSYDELRRWYEEQGARFTGWSDISSRSYFGVGVRWAS